MNTFDSQVFDSYVPIYDVMPTEWNDARGIIVEQLKKISQAINVREIGFFLDEELLTGKSFIPTTSTGGGSTSNAFRTILRKVIEFPGLTIGVNTQLHGINVDANFSLIQLFGAATNATTLSGEPIPNGTDTISYDVMNIIITVSSAYTRAWAIIEYMQEL
jgi:hypothetical protein